MGGRDRILSIDNVTIEGVEAMPIEPAAKKKIYADNARALFRLPV